MRTVYLHVGRHKTGTTSIQRLMYDRRDDLASKGYHVVSRDQYEHLRLIPKHVQIPPTNLTNLFDLSCSLLRPTLMTYPRLVGRCPVLNGARLNTFTAEMNAFLHACPGDSLILSTEDMSHMRVPSEFERLRQVLEGFDVRTLLFERDRDAWIQSYKIQTQRLRERFGAVVGNEATLFDYRPNSWLLNLEPIKANLPNVETRQYETVMDADGSTIPEFLRWIGLDPAEFGDSLDIWENDTATKLIKMKARPIKAE